MQVKAIFIHSFFSFCNFRFQNYLSTYIYLPLFSSLTYKVTLISVFYFTSICSCQFIFLQPSPNLFQPLASKASVFYTHHFYLLSVLDVTLFLFHDSPCLLTHFLTIILTFLLMFLLFISFVTRKFSGLRASDFLDCCDFYITFSGLFGLKIKTPLAMEI